MLKLTIETNNVLLQAQIKKAYNKALNTSKIDAFIKSIKSNLSNDIIVGLSGSHIWVSDKITGKRYAIIIL